MTLSYIGKRWCIFYVHLATGKVKDFDVAGDDEQMLEKLMGYTSAFGSDFSVRAERINLAQYGGEPRTVTLDGTELVEL